MATSIGNLSLIVSANITPLTSSLSKAGSGVASFAGGITGLFGGITGGILSGLGQIGHAIHGVRAIVNLIDDTILAPVKAAANFEVLVTSMSAMLGSVDKAKGLAQSVFEWAGRTPFEATELLDASKKLLAFGTTADRVMPSLKVLGDIAAGSGKDLGELVVIFGQIKSAGRLLGQDMLQLNQANIPITAALAKRFEVSELALRKMVEAGKVGFRDVAEELQKMTESGGIFFKQMEARSGTLPGRWTKVVNEFKQGMIQIGNSMVDNLNLKPLLDDVLLLAQAFRDWMAEGGLQRSWAWLSNAVTVVGGKFLDLVDIFKIVGSAASDYIGLPMQKLLSDILYGVASLMDAMSKIPTYGWMGAGVSDIKAIADQWGAAMAEASQVAEKFRGTKIGDSRAQFAAGMQSFNDWMAGLRAAAAAKEPGFFGKIFRDAIGSIASGAATVLGIGETKLGKTEAALFGSKEAASILARNAGGGSNTLERLMKDGNKIAERGNKIAEEGNRLAKDAAWVIVDF